MIYRIRQFLAFSLDRRRLLCLPPFTLRASCVGSISLPLRQVSASFSLPLPLFLHPFLLPAVLTCSLFPLVRSVLSFPRSSLHVAGSTRTIERRNRGMAMSLGVRSAYIGVSCTQTIDSTRQGADCYCRRSPRLVNQLCVRACGKSPRSCRDSTPPCLCVNACLLRPCVCVRVRACAWSTTFSARGTMSNAYIPGYDCSDES